MDYEVSHSLISKRRKFLGMTQSELAKKANLSLMSIRRYESGDRKPNYEVTKRIATALDCDVTDLLTENQVIQHLIDELKDSETKAKRSQLKAEKLVKGDYLISFANALIEYADTVLYLKQEFNIRVISRSDILVEGKYSAKHYTADRFIKWLERITLSRKKEVLSTMFNEEKSEE